MGAKHTAEPWKASGMDVKQDVGPRYGGRAAAEWLAQAHIKPLFDLVAKAEGGQQ